MNVFLNEETVEEIAKAENKFRALSFALREKKIRYESVGLISTIKHGFTNFVLSIVSIFQK